MIVGKALQSLDKFEQVASWIPASASKARVEVGDFHLDLDTCPASQRNPPLL
jgi:hypothetical protein